jgi:rhodanese-related sulfurtransferase
MEHTSTKVLENPVVNPETATKYFIAKLEYATDSADLYYDLLGNNKDIVIFDTRSRGTYIKGHIPTAISFPDEKSVALLDKTKTYITYCDGIGCNGSTKGAFKLSSLGFKAKELIGGFDWWQKRDGYPVAEGPEPGSLIALETPVACDC